MDVGAGAFTGCHQVEEIWITVQSDGTSALREILTELPETIRVDWKKEGLKGVFWFPEFFEEGVENTPGPDSGKSHPRERPSLPELFCPEQS